MSIKKKFITIRDNYVINQVQKLQLPEFPANDVKRYKIIFKGRVQHVGFRLELSELAKRLALTGFCKNLENGDVFAEIQGPENKIQFLVSFMESLIRIKIREKEMKEIEALPGEKIFSKEA